MHRAVDILREYNSKDSAWLVERAENIGATVKALATKTKGEVRIRIHGNFGLAQVLVVRGDAYFVHFEDGLSSDVKNGDLRQSPLKDVADMMCSFDDAAAMAIRSAQTMNTAAEAEQIRTIAAMYNTQVRTAFYEAYCTACAVSPVLQTYAIDSDALRLYSIDNRVNEILKCLHHPDSLEVIIQSLVRTAKKV